MAGIAQRRHRRLYPRLYDSVVSSMGARISLFQRRAKTTLLQITLGAATCSTSKSFFRSDRFFRFIILFMMPCEMRRMTRVWSRCSAQCPAFAWKCTSTDALKMRTRQCESHVTKQRHEPQEFITTSRFIDEKITIKTTVFRAENEEMNRWRAHQSEKLVA